MIRMNVNRILPLMLLLVLFASCSRKYKVEGVSSVTSLDGKMLYLKTLRDGQWITIDSAEVVHGLFSTSGPSDSVMMVTLYMNDEAIMPLVLENGKVEVSISNSQLTAKGTPLNNALYEFIEKRNSLELKIEELEKKEARMVLDGAALDDIHEQLTQEVLRLKIGRTAHWMRYIQSFTSMRSTILCGIMESFVSLQPMLFLALMRRGKRKS